MGKFCIFSDTKISHLRLIQFRKNLFIQSTTKGSRKYSKIKSVTQSKINHLHHEHFIA